jgi:lipopolysaccharide export system permease protein
MKLLSGMIVKEWFKSLSGAVIVLFLLITTADLINGFLQGKEFDRVVLEYILKMPDLMGKMLPICCLVASLFSFNRLKSHAELISILAAGYSYRRIYVLIGVSAFFVVLLQFFNLGFIEPLATLYKRSEIQKSKKSEGRYLTRSSIEGGKFWYKSQNYFASFSYFDRPNSTLRDFEIYFFNEKHNSSRIIRAASATFQKNGSWLLLRAKDISQLDTPTFPLESWRPSLEIFLAEVPLDFAEFEADLTTLTFFKLHHFVSRLSKTGINVAEYQIILLNKIFLSFICLVFALLPVSSIFNPNRRSDSFGKKVVQTLLITVTFWVLYSSSVALGNSGTLSPLFATGFVPFTFFAFVLWIYFKNQKLSI